MLSSILRVDLPIVSNQLLELIGCITAVVATALISFNAGQEFLAFVLYGISNLAWIWYAFRIRSRWLLVQNAAFTIFTINGLINFWS